MWARCCSYWASRTPGHSAHLCRERSRLPHRRVLALLIVLLIAPLLPAPVGAPSPQPQQVTIPCLLLLQVEMKLAQARSALDATSKHLQQAQGALAKLQEVAADEEEEVQKIVHDDKW